MVSASLDMLEESLVKKLEVMSKIEKENIKQKEILTNPSDDTLNTFDETLDRKGEYIDQLISLDDGFQTLFDNVKKEIGDHKELYAEQIKRMQGLIHDITDLSASLEVQERRNKKLAEDFFSIQRQDMNHSRSSSVAAFNYYQTMNNFKNIPPQFMDKKN